MHSIRDLKKEFIQNFNMQELYFIPKKQANSIRSFWDKLNRLGWEKRTKDTDETSNVDSTAYLLPKEWKELRGELQKLISQKR